MEAKAKTEKPEEMETVTIELPKCFMDLLRAYCEEPVKEYIEHTIVCHIKADIDAGDVFVENIVEKYGLNPVFQKFVDDPAKP
jgi:uncharacterized membrane-anchored protein YjiN (DUF445 family)